MITSFVYVLSFYVWLYCVACITAIYFAIMYPLCKKLFDED